MGDDRDITYVEDDKVIYRASGAGTCSNLLYYSRIGEFAQQTPEWLQQKYDQGHEGEPIVIKWLEEEQGWKVVDTQREVMWNAFGNVWVRGHIDGMKDPMDDMLKEDLVEIKCLPEDSFKKIKKKKGLKEFPYYETQISIYHALTNADKALLVVGIKDKDGVVKDFKVIDVTSQLIPLDVIRNKLMKIEASVRKERKPYEECDYKAFPCPFFHMHPEDDVTEDVALDELCEQYNDISGHIKHLEKQKADLKKEISAILGMPSKKKTKLWVANWYLTKRTNLDMERLKEDVNLAPYQTVTEVDTLRVEPSKESA